MIFVACEYGKFGIGCARTCHCNNQTCDPHTGTCPPGGWKRGYTGISCSTGMYQIYLATQYKFV